MTTQEILNKYGKNPQHVLDTFAYADNYADGLVIRGTVYGIAVGIILTLIVLAVII